VVRSPSWNFFALRAQSGVLKALKGLVSSPCDV
jgi:hypothetical protein